LPELRGQRLPLRLTAVPFVPNTYKTLKDIS